MKVLFIKKKHLTFGVIAIVLLFAIISFSSCFTKSVFNFSKLEKVVVIDAGHGSIDPGATYNGLKEKDINLQVAFLLKKLLEESNIKVVMTRTDDSLYNQSRRQDFLYRVRKTNEVNADAFISIHVNKFPTSQPFGGQAYYYSGEKSKMLSEKIQEQLKNIQPTNYRSIGTGNYFVLKKTKCPAVLVEIGFISNPIDRKRITDPKEQQLIAKAIRDGLLAFFNEEFSTTETSINEIEESNYKIADINNGIDLYYTQVTQQGENLVPVHINLPRDKILSVASTAHLTFLERTVVESINKLITGPDDQSLVSVIPKNTELLSLKVTNKIATLNFNKNFISNHWASAESEQLTIESIVKTLTNLPGIDQVQIFVEGQKIDTIAGHLILDKPLTREMFR